MINPERNTRAILRRGLTTLIVATILAPLSFLSAFAQPRAKQVVVVYDSSGSMLALTENDYVKAHVARAAFNELGRALLTMPEPIKVGVVAFGSKVQQKGSDPVATAIGCRDVETIADPAIFDSRSWNRLEARIRGLPAIGYTPLANAIDRAVDMLGDAGGTLVVITDSEQTCNTDAGTACNVLLNANRHRTESNRVDVDSIIVPRKTGMKLAVVDELARCTGAKRIDLTRPSDAKQQLGDVAARITARLTDRDTALTAPPMSQATTLKVVRLSLSPNGSATGTSPMVEIRRSGDGALVTTAPLPRFSSPTTVEPGNYEVSLMAGEREMARSKDVSLRLGDNMTVYFFR